MESIFFFLWNVKIRGFLFPSILEILTWKKYSFKTIHSPLASKINTFQYYYCVKETACNLSLAETKGRRMHLLITRRSYTDFWYEIYAWDNGICIDYSCMKEVQFTMFHRYWKWAMLRLAQRFKFSEFQISRGTFHRWRVPELVKL